MLYVLLIDDSDADRALATRVLEREFADLTIRSVSNQREFEQALQTVNYDIAITDYQLGWSDGLTILSLLKQHYPERPVVMFTNSGTQEVAVEAMKAGLDDYVLKSPKHCRRLPLAVQLALQHAAERQRNTQLEQRLQGLLNRLDVGIFRATLSGQVLEANAAFLALIGVTTQTEAQTFNLNQLFPSRLQTVVAIDASPAWEGLLHRGDGTTTWVRWSETQSTVGHEPWIEGLVEDISDRKRIEAERQESEERFRLIANTAPMLLWMADSEQHCYFFNRSWLSFTGHSLEQAIEVGRLANIHPEDKQRCWDHYAAAFEARTEFTMDYRLRRRDGEYRWVLERGVPRFAPDQTFMGYIGSAIDITERKRAEAALQFLAEASTVLNSSLDYETTLAQIAHLAVPKVADWCAIDVLNEHEVLQRVVVVHADPEMARCVGELQRQYPLDSQTVQGIAKVLQTGKTELYNQFSEDNLKAHARDAQHLNLLRALGLRSAMIVPLVTQGRTLGTISFVSAESGRMYTDTDRALAEELARRAALAIDNARLYAVAQRDRARAESANRLKDEFLATISHELRTPLSSILGWAQLLQANRWNEASLHRALAAIERNAKQQTQLIEDILDVSQIIRGQLRLTLRPMSVLPPLEAAIATVQPTATAKAIALEMHIEPEIGYIAGDAERIQQIFWNLLSNAVKFTFNGGRVTVSLKQVGGKVEFSVQDTGIGIRPDFLPHVFERFSQADGSTTRYYGGLGLGLAIVRHFVELHGGTVQADSPGPGQGATFTITFPLMAEDTLINIPPIGPQTEDQELHQFQGLQVLVVEDEPDGRELLTFMLRDQGANVTAVDSVSQALDWLQQQVPDLLISDISLPDGNGYDLMRMLRTRSEAQGGRVPAIALTVHSTEEHYRRALSAGFQAHVSKPVEPEALLSLIRHMSEAH